jgi:hypothetical protein
MPLSKKTKKKVEGGSPNGLSHTLLKYPFIVSKCLRCPVTNNCFLVYHWLYHVCRALLLPWFTTIRPSMGKSI